MTNITSLIYDPSPGVTPGDGSIIRTDMYNAIADLLNGISGENYNLVQKISKKTANYTMLLTDFAIVTDATSGAITITLPDATATGISRKILAIKKDDSTVNAVTVATVSSQTIEDGGPTSTKLISQGEMLILQSDGTNWQVLSRYLMTYATGQLKVYNPAGTFTTSFTSSAILANRNLAIPLLTADDTIAVLGLSNVFSADQTIKESGASARMFLEAYGTGFYGDYVTKTARGTSGSPSALLSGDIIAAMSGRAYGASSFSTAGIAQIQFIAAENLSNTAYGSYVSILTTKKTTTTLSEVARFGDDGTFSITNPAFTQKYIITGAAITADRILNLPLITATDTLAVLGLAQTFTKGQTISPATLTALTLNPPTAPTGSSSVFYGALKVAAGTIAFATTAQSGDYYTNYIDQATLTNPSSGTITNATTLYLKGAPIASTNVTITNAYALWVAAGTTKLDGSISATGLLTSTGGITMSSADITLAGNKIKTTSYNLYEQNDIFGNVSLSLTSSVTNGVQRFMIYPNGTTRANLLELVRTSDLTNYESLVIGTDVGASNEMAIQSTKGGTGTLRPINVYMSGTKLLSFDTANTITHYVDTNIGTNKLKTNITDYYTATVLGQLSNFMVTNIAAGGVHSFGTGANGVVGLQLVSTTDFTTNYEALRIDDGITTSNTWTLGSIKGGTGTARPIVFQIGGTNILVLSSGIQVGSPTGGDKGSGTANFAGDIYKNNTAYTNPDYVFEKYYTGNIIKYVSNEGAKDYKGLRTLKDLEDYVKQNHRFPTITSESMGVFARADKMLEISEELCLYLFDHEKRLLQLEATSK